MKTRRWDYRSAQKESKNYKNPTQWLRASKGSFEFAKRMGLLDAFTEHMIKKDPLTHDSVKVEALKFSSKREWQIISPGSYDYATKHKIINKLSRHMFRPTKEKSLELAELIKNKKYITKRWDKAKVLADAKVYSKRKDWLAYSSGAFHYALRHNFVAECIAHMEKSKKEAWTVEKCLERSKKFKTLKEWTDNDRNSVYASKRLGCFQECSLHVVRINKPKHFWMDPVNVKKEMQKYNTRREFEASPSYRYALKFHNEILNKKYPKIEWSSTSLGENSARVFLEKVFKTKFEKKLHKFLMFPETGRPLELDGYSKKNKIAFEYGDHKDFNKKKKIDNKVYARVLRKDKFKQKKCDKLGIKLLQLIHDSLLFKNPATHLKAQIKAELIRIQIPVPELFENTPLKIIPFKNHPWQPNKIWKLAKKVKSIGEFRKKYIGAFDAAIRLSIINDIRKYYRDNYKDPKRQIRNQAKMKKVAEIAERKANQWNVVKIWDLIKKSTGVADLQKQSSGAYAAAIKLGIIDDLRKALKSKGNQKRRFSY